MVSARAWGFGPGLVSAGFAAVAFIYFVLPPAGFTIQDPNDWIALASFLVGAGFAGGMMVLADRSERQRQHFRDLYWDLVATHKREMAQRRVDPDDVAEAGLRDRR
jgi:K+-sensing histidine kinase KdpD